MASLTRGLNWPLTVRATSHKTTASVPELSAIIIYQVRENHPIPV